MNCDYLVIGSGIAGLSFALRAAQWGTVIIATKKRDVDTATNLAQGGIAAVLDEQDSCEAHIKDTLLSGDGLCDLQTVEMVVRQGPSRIRDLINHGVSFVRDADTGSLDLGREGGHSKRRIAHAYDMTGKEIEMKLLDHVKKNKNISVLEDSFAVDLLIRKRSGKKICFGAYIMTPDNTVTPFTALKTILCTGGMGKVYLYTSNPDIATGDGVAMAARGGAAIANMEFVQFHPTCLYHPTAKNFLISEAVRGEGAVLVARDGQRFMDKYDKRAELATRDMVARSIDRELKERGDACVYLDITAKSPRFIEARFPGIFKTCLEYGIDIRKEPIPVVPAAHYLCGGVLVDRWGNTTVQGLMALGETSCTGLHGANRLASNSLLEAVVYAERAATFCYQNKDNGIAKSLISEVDSWRHGKVDYLEEAVLINHDWDLVRRTMWNYVGIVRTTKRLEIAEKRLRDIAREIEKHYRNYYVSAHMVELRNIVHIALLVIRSACLREESRGLHFSLDFPDKRKEWEKWIVLTRKEGRTPWNLHADFMSYKKDYSS